MTPETQRILIAEACGWRRQLWGKKPHEVSWITPQQCYGECPDYLSDLNAMHGAVFTLKGEQIFVYVDRLQEITMGKDNEASMASMEGAPESSVFYRCINATAEQRAEAFLRTIGKWEDSQ